MKLAVGTIESRSRQHLILQDHNGRVDMRVSAIQCSRNSKVDCCELVINGAGCYVFLQETDWPAARSS